MPKVFFQLAKQLMLIVLATFHMQIIKMPTNNVPDMPTILGCYFGKTGMKRFKGFQRHHPCGIVFFEALNACCRVCILLIVVI